MPSSDIKQILAFGDSNTWGYISGTLDWTTFTYEQFPKEVRYPGRLQTHLGSHFRIIEAGLPGRTIMTDDPNMPGVNGMRALPQLLEIHQPLSACIVMLGTNDLKAAYQLSADKITAQLAALCVTMRASGAQYDCSLPKIVIVAPPAIQYAKLDPSFQAYYHASVDEESQKLRQAYERLAKENHYLYCACAQFISSDQSDGLHLDKEMHQSLAADLSTIIMENC